MIVWQIEVKIIGVCAHWGMLEIATKQIELHPDKPILVVMVSEPSFWAEYSKVNGTVKRVADELGHFDTDFWESLKDGTYSFLPTVVQETPAGSLGGDLLNAAVGVLSNV